MEAYNNTMNPLPPPESAVENSKDYADMELLDAIK